jgi:hypothetical protein
MNTTFKTTSTKTSATVVVTFPTGSTFKFRMSMASERLAVTNDSEDKRVIASMLQIMGGKFMSEVQEKSSKMSPVAFVEKLGKHLAQADSLVNAFRILNSI